jgi:hypothetical protein
LVLVLGLAGGCGDASETGLLIEANRRPSSGCGLTVSDGREVIGSGTFDLVLGDRSAYILTPFVLNELGESVTLERVHIEATELRDPDEVRLSFVCAGGEVCEHWIEELCTGGECPTIAPGERESFEVPALSPFITRYYQSGLDLAIMEGRVPPEYRLRVQLVLETSTGAMSDPFFYELTICLGCLVEYPPGTDDPRLPGPDCCGAAAPLPEACYPGQDEAILCRDCIRTVPEICNFGRFSCDF